MSIVGERPESGMRLRIERPLAGGPPYRYAGELATAERDAANRSPIVVPAKRSDSLTDEATGLFSEDYFRVAVDARIAAARRHLRPVAVVLLEVIEGLRSNAPQSAQPMQAVSSMTAMAKSALLIQLTPSAPTTN